MALAVYIGLDFVMARNKSRSELTYKVNERGEIEYQTPKMSDGLNLFQKLLVIGGAILYAVMIGLARMIEDVDTVN